MNANVVVAGLAMLAVFCVFGIVLAVYLRRRRGFLARAQTVPAVITGTRWPMVGLGRGGAHFARVSFTARDGRPVTTEVRLFPSTLGPRLARGVPAQAGRRVWVDYDAVNPARAELNLRFLDTVRPPARPR